MIAIRLFGNFDFDVDGAPVDRFRSRKSRSLLILLILGRSQSMTRDHVASMLWPEFETDRARKALNTEIWRLGRSLEDAGLSPSAVLSSTAELLQFRPESSFCIDIDTFEAGTAAALKQSPDDASEETLAEIEAALHLYRGDLLETVYDDWCLVQREALRGRFMATSEFMISAAMARGNWTAALTTAHDLLAMDPLMEHVHRAAMRCHYHMGNRPAALRQYELCATTLRHELDVEPMGETKQVYDTIRAVAPRLVALVEDHRPVTVDPASRPPGMRRPPAEEVDFAISNLDQARRWLVDANDQLKRR